MKKDEFKIRKEENCLFVVADSEKYGSDRARLGTIYPASKIELVTYTVIPQYAITVGNWSKFFVPHTSLRIATQEETHKYYLAQAI